MGKRFATEDIGQAMRVGGRRGLKVRLSRAPEFGDFRKSFPGFFKAALLPQALSESRRGFSPTPLIHAYAADSRLRRCSAKDK
jgi:hypothetical protein